MSELSIELTAPEREILNRIELDVTRLKPETSRSNGKAVVELLALLGKRRAIPEVRLHFWDDPEYQRGRYKDSHKGIFERSGNRGAEIYSHPHFLEFLRYFLHGADLPASAISAFKEKVGNPDWITSGDVIPLGNLAKTLTRSHGLASRSGRDCALVHLPNNQPQSANGTRSTSSSWTRLWRGPP
jgi:hypothetical protein